KATAAMLRKPRNNPPRLGGCSADFALGGDAACGIGEAHKRVATLVRSEAGQCKPRPRFWRRSSCIHVLLRVKRRLAVTITEVFQALRHFPEPLRALFNCS